MAGMLVAAILAEAERGKGGGGARGVHSTAWPCPHGPQVPVPAAG